MALKEWIKDQDRQHLKAELLTLKSSIGWKAITEFLEFEAEAHRALMYDAVQRGDTHLAAAEAGKDLTLQYVKGRFLEVWIDNLDGKSQVQEEARPEE